MLLWTKSLVALQLVQVCYGFYMASEVAYYTYMYAKVDKSRYQKVTSYARTSTLSGRFLASIIAQILVSFDLMDLRELNYLTFGGKKYLILSLIYCINFINLISSSNNFTDRCCDPSVSWNQFIFLCSS